MKSHEGRVEEAAEFRQASENIGRKELVRREPQLNPEGANRDHTHTNSGSV